MKSEELTRADKASIAGAIAEAEKMTSGEIRVHLVKRCPKDVMTIAERVFRKLKMHRTKEGNAVLIFVATESRQFAILGDSGIHARVGGDYWSKTRDLMLSYFSKDQLSGGIVAGVLSVGEELKKYFPITARDKNELPNQVTEE